jgi:hypothetical protein
MLAPMKTTHYQITVRGQLSETMVAALGGDLTATQSGTGTVLSGEIVDQSALYGVLERMESLGLELVAVRSTTPSEVSPCHPC